MVTFLTKKLSIHTDDHNDGALKIRNFLVQERSWLQMILIFHMARFPLFFRADYIELTPLICNCLKIQGPVPQSPIKLILD